MLVCFMMIYICTKQARHTDKDDTSKQFLCVRNMGSIMFANQWEYTYARWNVKILTVEFHHNQKIKKSKIINAAKVIFGMFYLCIS